MADRGNPNFKIFNSLAQFFSKNKQLTISMSFKIEKIFGCQHFVYFYGVEKCVQ